MNNKRKREEGEVKDEKDEQRKMRRLEEETSHILLSQPELITMVKKWLKPKDIMHLHLTCKGMWKLLEDKEIICMMKEALYRKDLVYNVLRKRWTADKKLLDNIADMFRHIEEESDDELELLSEMKDRLEDTGRTVRRVECEEEE